MERKTIGDYWREGKTVPELMKMFGLSRSTVYRALLPYRTKRDKAKIREDWNNLDIPTSVITEQHGFESVKALYAYVYRQKQHDKYFKNRAKRRFENDC